MNIQHIFTIYLIQDNDFIKMRYLPNLYKKVYTYYIESNTKLIIDALIQAKGSLYILISFISMCKNSDNIYKIHFCDKQEIYTFVTYKQRSCYVKTNHQINM